MFSVDIKYIVYSIFFSANSRLYWLFVLLYILVGLAIIVWKSKSNRTFRHIIFKLFPSDIYTHPSFFMDLKIWVVSILLTWSGIFSFFFLAVKFLATTLVSWIPLESTVTIAEATISDRLLFTVIVILVFDFGYFLGHYLSHKIPALWAFHQVHHAAERLTPISSLRFHPVDYLFTAMIGVFMSTAAVSAFSLYHSTEIELLTVLNVSVIYFLFQLLSNFRHSHIWISYGPYISKMFVSPSMHQVHHSIEKRHIDLNFGLIFSCWDAIFRSLYIPIEREVFETGLADGSLNSNQSLLTHLSVPFLQSYSAVKRWLTGCKKSE